MTCIGCISIVVLEDKVGAPIPSENVVVAPCALVVAFEYLV
jgi:hypothetical protein